MWQFAHTDRTLAMRREQIGLFLAAFALFLVAVAIVWRVREQVPRWVVWFVVIAGIAFRVSVAPVLPVTTSDIHRYLWEGRVVRAGFNPFAERPDSPRLAHLRDDTWARVSFKYVPAAYPPVAQYVFALAGVLPGDPLVALKLAFAAFDIGTVLLLPGLLARAGRPRVWVLVHAWHPLIVGEVVARGHLDSVGVFFLVLGARLFLSASRQKGRLAGSALAASALAKGYALFTLPFFLVAAGGRRAWLVLGIVSAAVVLYLPFASAGSELWRGITLYSTRWEGYASVFQVVKLTIGSLSRDPANAARGVCGALLAAWLGYLLVRGRRRGDETAVLDASFAALAGFFLLSPVLYPWYLSWTLPFLCLRPRPAWLLLTGTVFLFYYQGFAPPHREIWWVNALEYGLPLAVAVGARVMAGSRRAPPNAAANWQGSVP